MCHLPSDISPDEWLLRRYPTVTRVKRTISYAPNIHKQRTIQRTIYW